MRVEATQANLLASTTRTKRMFVLFVLLGVALFFVSSMVVALPSQAATTITVNTVEDESTADGDCSLREAIIAANTGAPRDACPAGNAIVFDLGASPTITLGSTLPDTRGLIIDGEADGADVSISGNDQVRPFIVDGWGITLRNLTVTRGNADNADRFGGDGGAILHLQGNLRLSNVTISESNAQGRGGGIATPGLGSLYVTDSTFSGNHADLDGGAIYYQHTWLEVTNSTFTNNSAARGGALMSQSTGVINSTFAHNGASSGSAIFGEQGVEVYSSTFFNNYQLSGSELYPTPGSIVGGRLANTLISERDIEACIDVEDDGFNIENGDSCGFSEANQSMSNTDAKLDPLGLQDNGGPTQTIALQPTSPAIDFVPGWCLERWGGSPEVLLSDQRGEFRDVTGCDAGAFEAPPDETAPAAPTIASPEEGSSNPASFTISGTAEINNTVELFDGAVSKGTYQTGLSGEWSIELSDVSEGSHTYTAKATDRAGNTSTESSARTLMVDATAPEAPAITSPAEGGHVTGSFSLRGTTEANATVELFEGTTSKGTTKAGSDGRWSIALSGVTEGPHSYTARATDAVDNASAASQVRTVMVDTTAPAIWKVVPVETATGISPGTNVSAFFSEAMRAASVKSSFKLYKKGSTTALNATITYDAATKKAVLNPSANLQRGATYRVVVSGGAKDLAGNALDQYPSVTGNQMKEWFFTIKP